MNIITPRKEYFISFPSLNYLALGSSGALSKVSLLCQTVRSYDESHVLQLNCAQMFYLLINAIIQKVVAIHIALREKESKQIQIYEKVVEYIESLCGSTHAAKLPWKASSVFCFSYLFLR